MLTRAAELAPDNPLYLNQAGLMAQTLGNYDTAIEYYEKSLDSNLKILGPDHPEVATRWNNLGTAWQAKDEFGKAREYYNKALAIVKKAGLEHRIQLFEKNIRSLPPEK